MVQGLPLPAVRSIDGVITFFIPIYSLKHIIIFIDAIRTDIIDIIYNEANHFYLPFTLHCTMTSPCLLLRPLVTKMAIALGNRKMKEEMAKTMMMVALSTS